VHRLRAKLGESGSRPHFIHNIRGVGYRFEPQSTPRECRAILEYDDRAVLRGIESLNLTTKVVTKHGDPLAVKVTMMCRYEGWRLTGMSVDLTWCYQDIAETRSLT
jgi:hypothetical protein